MIRQNRPSSPPPVVPNLSLVWRLPPPLPSFEIGGAGAGDEPPTPGATLRY